MTAEKDQIRQLTQAVSRGDVPGARVLIESFSHLRKKELLARRLHDAARANNVAMMDLLLEFGADVNQPASASEGPEGPIYRAAGKGAADAVRWLLDHGAKMSFVVEGERRCFPLTNAVIGGHLDVVRLLVERGADVNATWGGQNAMSFAQMYGKKEIEAYLRSCGGISPGAAAKEDAGDWDHLIRSHVERFLGPPSSLSLKEIVAGDLPISIDVVRLTRQTVLVTRGMSSQPMYAPNGQEAFSRAELCISLPPDWPVEDFQSVERGWPARWLMRLARYPHDNRTWLGGPAAIIANGEPPKPLAPNTSLCCLLLLATANEFGRLGLADGTQVQFYSVYPLYKEERDFELAHGMPQLIELMRQHRVSAIVDIHRPNIVTSAS